MLCYVVLCCRCCVVLRCAVLYCVALSGSCSVLFFMLLCCVVSSCLALPYFALPCVVLCCVHVFVVLSCRVRYASLCCAVLFLTGLTRRVKVRQRMKSFVP